MNTGDIVCHICQKGRLRLIDTFSDLGLVTSDSCPWKKGGAMAICSACGTIQKPLTKMWRSETKTVYEKYQLYHQDKGLDQVVFDQASGQGMPRARRIVDSVNARTPLSPAGRLLDYGCGEGAMLTAFSDFSVLNLDGAWSLYGYDPYIKNETAIRAIPGVKDVYTETVEGTFDLITLIHSLEHIENPISFLRSIAPLLTQGGQVLVQVPYVWDNPFDLLVVDHCTHFTMKSLSLVVSEAGFEVISIDANVIPRELTVLARPIRHAQSDRNLWNEIDSQSTIGCVSQYISWIRRVREEARSLSQSGGFGIFGTAIAGTWLYGELADNVDLFVDENQNRAGSRYMGCPVYVPKEAPKGADVFMALSYPLAEKITKRIGCANAKFHLPTKPECRNPEHVTNIR